MNGRYVIRLGSMRGDGLYVRAAVDVDEWVVTSSQRGALRFSGLYAADICAEGIGDARIVRLSRRATQVRSEPKP